MTNDRHYWNGCLVEHVRRKSALSLVRWEQLRGVLHCVAFSLAAADKVVYVAGGQADGGGLSPGHRSPSRNNKTKQNMASTCVFWEEEGGGGGRRLLYKVVDLCYSTVRLHTIVGFLPRYRGSPAYCVLRGATASNETNRVHNMGAGPGGNAGATCANG